MMKKLHLIIGLKFQSISQFFIQVLLVSVLALTAPHVFAVTMDKNFDHYNTNFPLDGAHKRTRCDRCHKRGVFKGTPQTCQFCHGTGSKVADITKSSTHVRVVGTCDTCHTQNSWQAVRMDHSAVSGTCKSCHGVKKGVTGPPPNHSKLDCGECHRSSAWRPATGYAHSPEDTNCVLCHTPGGRASKTAKSASHIPIIAQDCSACHRNDRRRFKPISVKPMPHDGVVSTDCKSCHNGSQKGSGAQSYTDARRLNHQIGVTDLNDCRACHKTGYSTWNGGTNIPVPARNVSGHNGKFTPEGCRTSGCHSGGAGAAPLSHTSGMASIAVINASCADCHANGRSVMKHSGNTRPNQCKVCHSNSGAGKAMNNKKVSSAIIHATTVTSPETSACDDCHKERDKGGSFLPVSMRAHMGIRANSCGNCHNGQLSNSRAIKYSNAQHPADLQCQKCHSRTSAGSFNRADKNGVHANTTQGCSMACHRTGLTFPINTDKMRADHVSSVSNSPSCDICHRSGDSRWVPPQGRIEPDSVHRLLVGYQGRNGPERVPGNRSCVRCH
ncbi:MAG: hypothetical protein ACC657_05405 [Thiohalomonadales bacterium]